MKSCESSKSNNQYYNAPRILRTVLTVIFLTAHAYCYATQETASPGLQFHGFASQSLITTSDNNFFGNTDDNVSFDYTELGLNLSTRPAPTMLVALQILARRAGEGHENDLEVDYGLIDYRAVTNESGDLGVRLGRIQNPFGLYNDTRDVAFTRPSVILPQSIYFDRVRDLALSADGVHLYGERRMKWGFISLQLGAARLRLNSLETEMVLLGDDRPGELEDKISFIGRILFSSDDEKIRVALSGTEVNIDYIPGQNDPSEKGDITFSPLIFSFQYHDEHWNFTSEYARRKFRFNNIIYSPLDEFTGESYYFQFHHRIKSGIWGFVRHDVTYLNNNDKNGKKFEALTLGARPDYSQFARDWTIGARWEINNHWMVAAEHHWVDGTAWLPALDNPNPLETRRRWRMFMMITGFRF